MLCKNCNYILSGKESFCPNCGMLLPSVAGVSENQTIAEEQKRKEEIKTLDEAVFSLREEEKNQSNQGIRIFNIDNPEEDYEEKNSNKTEKKEHKNGAGKIFLLLFLCCALAAAAFGVADYFEITPGLSKTAGSFGKKDTESSGNVVQNFSHKETVIEPEFEYAMETAYVLSGRGLTLRKGPANSFAPLYELMDFSVVKIFGGSLVSENWLYVYCPEKNCYGWLDGSFLCSEEVIAQKLEKNRIPQEEIPTNYYNEEY